jgi:hypothetical protein
LVTRQFGPIGIPTASVLDSRLRRVHEEGMRTIGHVTPHAWAMDAFRALLFRGATLVDIVPEILVLAAFAAVLLAASGLRFRRLIATGAI